MTEQPWDVLFDGKEVVTADISDVEHHWQGDYISRIPKSYSFDAEVVEVDKKALRKLTRQVRRQRPHLRAGLHRVHTGDYVFDREDGNLYRLGKMDLDVTINHNNGAWDVLHKMVHFESPDPEPFDSMTLRQWEPKRYRKVWSI